MVSSEDLKELRKIMRLKQKELAELIGVSVGTIQNYEKGGVIPKAKERMISQMLNEARLSVESNSGIANTGNSIGGHNINISHPDIKKIIEPDKVTIELDKPAEEYRREIEDLKNKIAYLERINKVQQDLIDVLMKTQF